jgi:hypothetical protein
LVIIKSNLIFRGYQPQYFNFNLAMSWIQGIFFVICLGKD